MKVSYKKGASIYLHYWVYIKDNPRKFVVFNITQNYHKKLSKAIKNRKLKDLEYKNSNPSARLLFVSKDNYLKVILLPDGRQYGMLLDY